MTDAAAGIEKTCLDCQDRFVALKPWHKRCRSCHVQYKFGPDAPLREQLAENSRLRAQVERLHGELTAAHDKIFRIRCAMTKTGETTT